MDSRKTRFLHDKGKVSAYQMSSADISSIISYYSDRYNIKIIKNGTTELGEKIVAQNVRRKDNTQGLEDLFECYEGIQDVELKYVEFFLYILSGSFISNWNISAFDITYKDHFISRYREQIEQDIGCEFFDLYDLYNEESLLVKKKLNEKIAIACNKYGLLHELDLHIDKFKSKLEDFFNDGGLTIEECVEEMKQIQQNLSEGEVVGYVFTSGHQKLTGHFEVFILTNDKIVKPIEWPNQGGNAIDSGLCPGLFYPGIDSTIVSSGNSSTAKIPAFCPQAGDVECGTLGMVCLKELLKEDASQFNKHCLCLSYYTDDSKSLKNMFIPSPDILRYSQSSKYNEIFVAMLDTAGHQASDDHAIKALVESLKNILMKSIAIAVKKGDIAVKVQNEKTLEMLPLFCESWMARYKQADQKRSMMVRAENDKNAYLLFKTIRFKENVSESAPEAGKPKDPSRKK
jgi:hypothetical protein